MKTLLLIVGVLVLSGTDALAANSSVMDTATQGIKTPGWLSGKTTQEQVIQVGSSNQAIIKDSYLTPVNKRAKGLDRETLLAYEDDGRGSPDKRGEGGNR